MTFVNEPLLELRREAVRREALAALDALDAKLPLEVPMLIGEDVVTGRVFASVDPSSPTRIVANAHEATEAHVKDAVGRAQQGHVAWSRKPAADRAAALQRAAGILRSRRLELTALAVREAGKPWAEADGDVCEAIDFLEYYAQGALALDGGKPLIQLPGERNAMRYVARGVTGVIAPWNFPLAIAAGMVSAALATGNAVVLKPAEQAPACAKAVVDALHAGGVPLDALSPAARRRRGGQGAGRRPAHPHARLHRLLRRRPADPRAGRQGRPRPAPPQARDRRDGRQERGHRRLRRRPRRRRPRAAEVGLRLRGPEVLARPPARSCTRAIADELAERMAGAITTLRVGPAQNFGTDVPPVIDVAAQQRIQRYIASATPLAQAETRDDGFYVPPTIFAGLAGRPRDRAATRSSARSCRWRRSSRSSTPATSSTSRAFALTGGLFSRSPRTIDYVSERTPVGNLYVNREITGAMVGRQPFGGGKLSGTGPKAGGPDYLLQFVEARAVTENTVRHGLVV